MPGKPDRSRAEAERLYGLPLDDFTGERDAAARDLRKSGDREAAQVVGKLRKPTVAAWAVNQLARRHGDEMGALLEAGEELREAHEQLLAGKRGDAVGQAAAAERAAVGKLVQRARRLDLSPATLERVAETLHAVAGSEELREELRRGAVTREHQAASFGGLDLGTAGAAAARPASPRPKAKPRSKARPKAEPKPKPRPKPKAKATPKPRDDRPRLLKAARAELRRRQKAHGSAGRALEAAERRLAQARDQVAEREARADAARAQEADAQQRLAEAEAEVRRLEG